MFVKLPKSDSVVSLSGVSVSSPSSLLTSARSQLVKVLHQVHPNMKAKKEALLLLEMLLSSLLSKLQNQSLKLRLQRENCSILSSRDVQTSVRLVIPDNLAKNSVSQGVKHLTIYTSY